MGEGEKKGEEFDIFRHTPIRYLGFTNDVGESFRPVIPRYMVNATYGVAFAYVAADTADKGYRAYKNAEKPEERRRQAYLTFSDAMIWQLLATMILPGICINRLSWASRAGLTRFTSMPKHWVKVSSVVLGLVSIPPIASQVDRGVDKLMEHKIRPWLYKKKE